MSDNHDDNDRHLSLEQLASRNDTPVISQLVAIGDDVYQQNHSRARSFAENLHCLKLNELDHSCTMLWRESIDAYENRQYIALSHTWNRSMRRDGEQGQFFIQNWDEMGWEQSTVRDWHLNRILSYMRTEGVQYLWIDAHGIRQRTCKVDACNIHDECIEKREALQAMDLVYQLSEHPVALLSCTLNTTRELQLLHSLLEGSFVRAQYHRGIKPYASKKANFKQAREALQLVHRITRDPWWHSAWTFQENYCAAEWMKLLIHHSPSPTLEYRKLIYWKLFGTVNGELCVPSVDFFRETTRLCEMLKRRAIITRGERKKIDDVLQVAGRYTVLLRDGESMTPSVIANLEKRRISKPWDMLALVANCCQYSVRLNGELLRKNAHSLSLALFAMLLRNGEILDNREDNREGNMSIKNLTVSEFLKKFIFQRFDVPTTVARPLRFLKGCRLVDVELTEEGTTALGHVWKLGYIIDTAPLRAKLPWVTYSDSRSRSGRRLDRRQRQLLTNLALFLNRAHFLEIAKMLDGYLKHEANLQGSLCFRDEYHYYMATELTAAIEKNRPLRLAVVHDSECPERYTPYRAIFVCPDEETATSPDFVFTSMWERDYGSESHEVNDVDHHVSIAVDIEDADMPELRVHHMMYGMCFFNGISPKRVRFPWPRPLLNLGLKMRR